LLYKAAICLPNHYVVNRIAQTSNIESLLLKSHHPELKSIHTGCQIAIWFCPSSLVISIQHVTAVEDCEGNCRHPKLIGRNPAVARSLEKPGNGLEFHFSNYVGTLTIGLAVANKNNLISHTTFKRHWIACDSISPSSCHFLIYFIAWFLLYKIICYIEIISQNWSTFLPLLYSFISFTLLYSVFYSHHP